MTRRCCWDVGRVVVLVVVISSTACTSHYEAGRNATEQLCNVLGPAGDGATRRAGFSLEAELEGAARDPITMPSSLLAIQLAYRTNERSYDRLGRYEPAIRFAADLVDLSSEGLAGPSTLSPRVLASAQAVDRSLAVGGCP